MSLYKYHDDIKLKSFTSSTVNKADKRRTSDSSRKKFRKSPKMNLSKVLGLTYFFVILALVCHSVYAVPKHHDSNVEK